MSGSVGEIIQLHIGQAGVQIGNACWELYCLEHGINSDGYLSKVPEDESFKSFFSITSAMKAVPRVIMVDGEPNVIDELRKGNLSGLFHPDTLITGKEDCGSNFARGYYTIGSEFIDCVMANIRKMVEGCGNLRGFLIFRAISGGTGSGLGNLIMEKIQRDYTKTAKIEFIVFPSPSLSDLNVDPYNALLSTHKSIDICECSFLMDNQALYEICGQKLNINSPTFTNINRVIAQVISTFTASQRFYGISNIGFGEFPTNLVPYQRIRFPIISYSPLISVAKATYGKITTEQITNACFEPGNQLIKCDLAKGKCMACTLLYRGEVSPGDVNSSIANLKKKNLARFVDWSPTGFKVSINGNPGSAAIGGDLPNTNRSVVALTNNTSIQNTWCGTMIKFNKLLSRRAFVHHYVDEGLEESTFKTASENVCNLVKEYQKINSDNRFSLTAEIAKDAKQMKRK